MLALGPVRQARGQRVILASRRARENRRVQVAIVVSYAECGSNRCDRRRGDQEKRNADKSLAAPGATETCDRVSRLHGQSDPFSPRSGSYWFRSAQRAQPVSCSLFAHQPGTPPLVIGALACHLAVNSSLGLLPRNAGGDLGLLPINMAKADIAISPSWPRRERSQSTCAIARPSGLSATSAAPPRNEKPNFSVRFKSQPRCSVIRRGLARQVGSTEPAARRTTRRRPRSHRPDARP